MMQQHVRLRCVPAVVKKGQIVEQGNHASLMAENGAYATLVSLQNAEGAVGGSEGEGEGGDAAARGGGGGGAAALGSEEVGRGRAGRGWGGTGQRVGRGDDGFVSRALL